MSYDIWIEAAHIADGTGRPVYTANVGIRGGTIAYIGQEACGDAAVRRRLGESEVLCPGFIDSHGHSECYLFSDRLMGPKLRQGVTTEVSGNCGIGFAPVAPAYFTELQDNFAGVAVGVEPPAFWRELDTFSSFLDRVEGARTGINTAFYVAHGALRIAVKGYDSSPLTAGERTRMHALLREAMEAGAVGMSTGFVYAPGSYATREEIWDLCQIVAGYGGVYATHMRDEGARVLEAVEESIGVARRTGVRVLISHHKVTGRANAHLIEPIHRMVEAARGEGLSIHLDQYPYSAGETTLTTAIPYPYLDGGIAKLLERLRDPALRREIRHGVLHNDGTWQNPLDSTGFDGMSVLRAQNDPQAQGKSIARLAEERGLDEVEVIFRLLEENQGQVNCLVHFMDEGDVERIFQSPLVSVCTDSLLFGGGIPTHPRGYATYPKILGRFVREKRLVPLEEAVRKMTAMPADVFGMEHKGRVQVGMDADLVIFDRDRVIDHGSYEDPKAENEGIETVIVNGMVALDHGRLSQQAAGRVLRKRGGGCV